MTHYETLGVSKTATQKDIKAAFRKLSLATHPDVATTGTTKGNTELFRKISEANSILGNPNKRLQYDRELQEAAMWRTPNQHSWRGSDGAYSNYNNKLT